MCVCLFVCMLVCFSNLLRRPWFHKVIVNPDKTGISTAYMDAAGVGKIISISQVSMVLPAPDCGGGNLLRTSRKTQVSDFTCTVTGINVTNTL